MNIKLVLFSILACVLSGCFAPNRPQSSLPKTMSAVLVGTGYKCDKKELQKRGSDLDIATVSETIRYCENDIVDYIKSDNPTDPGMYDFRYIPNCSYYILQDDDATVNNVKGALTRAVMDDLTIVYFSCKAKQIPAKSDDEDDGLDEYVRLYDGDLVDNDIWEILKKARGRVFVMFETNYGSSMLKANTDGTSIEEENENLLIKLIEGIEKNTAKYDNQVPNILCWAACMENEELPERSIGSKFTNAFYFKSDKWYTYRETFDRIQNSLSNKQNIHKTVIGEDFQDRTLFR